jgi:hypothetical protein
MGSSRMPFPHLSNVRFTIRGLMIAVAAVAGLLGLLHTRPVIWLPLLAASLLNIPTVLICLVVDHDRPRGQRMPWRRGIAIGLQGAGILAVGWVWSLWANAFFDEGASPGIPIAAGQAARDRFWAVDVPMAATGLGLAAFLRLVVLDVSRRRPELVLIVAPYAWALALAWLFSFALLRLGSLMY